MYTDNDATDDKSISIAEHKHPDIFKRQRDILWGAINNYFGWRYNKSRDDGRGYPVTLFTYFRHMTKFGKRRANLLGSRLSPVSPSTPVSVLEQHFGANSTVDNHSLDTYLLEAIFQNKKLFLVVDAPFSLRSKESRILLRNIISGQEKYDHSAYAYHIGKLYAEDSSIENHMEIACFYYTTGARLGSKHAVDALGLLAQMGNNEARYALAVDYFHPQNQFLKAIKLCLLAADQGHEPAIRYLHDTPFGEHLCLSIARRYESGQGVVPNILSALTFYEKAYALNNSEAALRLGQLYQPAPGCVTATSSDVIVKNGHTAFNYYRSAAMQGSNAALSAMIELAKNSNDDDFYFIIGELYLDVFNNALNGLAYFKNLAEKNVEKAIKKLDELVVSNADHAYITGKLYEDDISDENHVQKALKYYSISLNRGHQEARKAIENMAATNNSDAQYILGQQYHHQGHFKAAINWCLLAAGQGHSLAKAYLFNTTFNVDLYLDIARHYEDELIPSDMAGALYFYEKALALNDCNAARRLGELYQPRQDNMPETSAHVEKDARKAFHYYSVAARQGCETSMTQLHQLADDLNDNNLHVVTAMLAIGSFGKSEQGLGLIKRLCDAQVPAAISALEEITEKNDGYACIVGKLYEDDVGVENHLGKALHYYTISLASDNKIALTAIRQMAANNHAEAEYILGRQWYLRRGKTNRGMEWCVRAAVHKHQSAIDYLLNTDFDASHCAIIADLFNSHKHAAHALLFYQRAFDKGSITAAIHLGALHNPHLNPDIHNTGSYQNNVEKSFEYYEFAAKKGEREALNALEQLVKHDGNETRQFRLAQIYLDSFNDIENAILNFKKSADRGYAPAVTQMRTLVTTNANGAYIIATLYEQELSLQKAAYYHMLAMQNNHGLSRESFNIIVNAESTSTGDLYAIAMMCFHGLEDAKNNFFMAKICFEKLIQTTEPAVFGEIYNNLGVIYQSGAADVNVDILLALNYFQLAENEGYHRATETIDTLIHTNQLTAPQLIKIASGYLNAPGKKDLDWHRILTCYERAASLGDISATRWLAELYQSGHKGIPNDNTKAFYYYLRLAELNDPDAFPPLERLAEEVGTTEQRELSRVYGRFFNHERANYWRKHVDETEKLAANFSGF